MSLSVQFYPFYDASLATPTMLDWSKGVFHALSPVRRAVEREESGAGLINIDSVDIEIPHKTAGGFFDEVVLDGMTKPHRLVVSMFGQQLFDGYLDLESITYSYARVIKARFVDRIGVLSMFSNRPPRLKYVTMPSPAVYNAPSPGVIELFFSTYVPPQIFAPGSAFVFSGEPNKGYIFNAYFSSASWGSSGITYLLGCYPPVLSPPPPGGMLFYNDLVFGEDICLYSGAKPLLPPYPIAQFSDAIAIIDAILKIQNPNNILLNQLGVSTFPCSLLYAAELVSDTWGETPVEVIKKLVQMMNAYLYVDSLGRFILKKIAPGTYPPPSADLTDLATQWEQNYSWRKVEDGVELLVKAPNGIESDYRKIRNNIKPRQLLEREVFWDGATPIWTQAQQMGDALFDIFCKRRNAVRVSTKFTPTMATINLTDTVSFMGKTYLVLEMNIDTVNRRCEWSLLDTVVIDYPNPYN